MAKLKKVMASKAGNQKTYMSAGATLAIKSETQEAKKANVKKIENIVKTFLNSKDGVEKLFNYVEGAGTKVFKKKNADKFLAKINEDEGFILPQRGLKALYLNLFLNKKIAFETPEYFILRNFNVNIYALCYQFYNWYCYKMNLDGYDLKTQENFKHVFEICETKKVTTLTYEEILNLKAAIKRDIEAIDFVINLAKEKDMAKKGLEKIKLKKSLRI